MKLTAYQFGLSIETTEDQTVIKGEHDYNSVLVHESYTKHESVDEAVCYHILAIQTLLHRESPIASTKVELVFGEDAPKDAALQARRQRLLKRIEEQKELMYECPNDGNHIEDLRDELQAVESALGYPEPKEPREASDETEAANTPAFCPTCLCLYDHEDPMQSCQCGG